MSLRKLDIASGSQLRILKVTPRQEKHGKEDIQAITVRVEYWWRDNEELNMLAPGLQDSVFWVPPEEVVQEKIGGLKQVKKHLRVPGMFPVKQPQVTYAGYEAQFEHGINDDSALALYESTLDKFEIDAKEGGGGCMRFNIGSNQQVTPELVGLLCSKERKEVKLIKLVPPQIKAEPARTDNGAPLLEQDTREAGQVLAENEAAGKNKPASEVPKPRGRKPKAGHVGSVQKPSLQPPKGTH